MKKNKFLLFAAIAMAVLTSCGGGQKGLPTSNEYPVVTIGPANAQLKTTYPATIKGVQDVEVRPKISGFITKLYVHEGQSVVMQQYAIDYDYGKLNNNDGANGYRDYGRVNWAGKSYNAGSLALEHTMYTNADNIANYISSQNVDMNRTYNSTFFNFVDYRLGTTRDLSNSLDSAYSDKYGPVVSDGQYIEIEHSQSYKTRFIYDESTNEYKMQQNYSDGQWRDTVDEAADNKVLTFPNVIVLYTDIHTYPGHEAKDLQYVEYAWGGIGYYCYGG